MQLSPLTELEPRVTLPWLVRLRWLGVAGQVLAILAARYVFELSFVWPVMGGVIVVTLLSNAALSAFARRTPPEAAASRVMGSVLALDTVSLTLLLAAAGGPMNPFTVVYLVHITLSAVVLSARWTTTIAVLAVLGFGALFLGPQDPHVFHRATSLSQHLRGMWIAFVLATGLTAFFVRRIADAVRRQREAIAELGETNERQARLASLTTLAAGAAHELGTPLGTIAIAAHEARAIAERLTGAAAVAADLELIELEVERCRGILTRMAAEAADHDAGGEVVTVDDVVARVRAELNDADARRLEVRLDGPAAGASPSPGELSRAVTALLRNAFDAAPSGPVVLELAARDGELRVRVEDRGERIPAEIVKRIGEPFFTTKEPGAGLGLGVFLVRTFAESRGGALDFDSDENGTRASLSIPVGGRVQPS